MLAVAIGAASSPRLRGRLGLRGGYLAALGLVAVCTALLGAPDAPLGFVALYLATYLSYGFVEPMHVELLNEAVGSEARATLISGESLAAQGGALVANLSVGALAAAEGTATAWAVAGVLLAVTGLLVAGRFAAGSSSRSSRRSDRSSVVCLMRFATICRKGSRAMRRALATRRGGPLRDARRGRRRRGTGRKRGQEAEACGGVPRGHHAHRDEAWTQGGAQAQQARAAASAKTSSARTCERPAKTPTLQIGQVADVLDSAADINPKAFTKLERALGRRRADRLMKVGPHGVAKDGWSGERDRDVLRGRR